MKNLPPLPVPAGWEEKRDRIETGLGEKIEMSRDDAGIVTGRLPTIALLKRGHAYRVAVRGPTEAAVVNAMFSDFHQARGGETGVIVRLDKAGNRADAFIYDKNERALRPLDKKNEKDRPLLNQVGTARRPRPAPPPPKTLSHEKAWGLLYELSLSERHADAMKEADGPQAAPATLKPPVFKA